MTGRSDWCRTCWRWRFLICWCTRTARQWERRDASRSFCLNRKVTHLYDRFRLLLARCHPHVLTTTLFVSSELYSDVESTTTALGLSTWHGKRKGASQSETERNGHQLQLLGGLRVIRWEFRQGPHLDTSGEAIYRSWRSAHSSRLHFLGYAQQVGDSTRWRRTVENNDKYG